MAVALPQTDIDGAYNLAERVRSSIAALRVPRIDGTGELRFDQGPQWSGKLHVDLRFFGPETGLHPAATFLKAPGCYAYQVDGLRFSYHVVFVARVAARELASAGWSWRSLHRPLHVPRIAPGTRCPVSKKTYASIGDVARLLPGPGPAYPDAGGGNATLEFFWPPLPSQADFYGSGWSGNKVLWWVDTTYAGPVLIRGRQLDGPHLLRFDTGAPPPAEIRIAPKRHAAPNRIGSARDRPSYTRVESPGCYGYQIDGVGFSRVIVFGAKVVPPPP
jgi:hypothetical protein